MRCSTRSTFKQDGRPSIAERINRKLIAAKLPQFRPMDNTRISSLAGKDRRGPMSGWDQMRARIIGTLDKDLRAASSASDTKHQSNLRLINSMQSAAGVGLALHRGRHRRQCDTETATRRQR